MKYAVGQVLYVVLKKENRVYPMQVVEEITKRTLQGEEISYKVRGGNDPKATLEITDVDGEFFDSAEKARSTLIERATKSINRLVDMAVQKAKEWYPGSFEAPSDDVLSALKKRPLTPVHDAVAGEPEEPTEDNLVTLPDGTVAKIRQVKIPDALKG